MKTVISVLPDIIFTTAAVTFLGGDILILVSTYLYNVMSVVVTDG